MGFLELRVPPVVLALLIAGFMWAVSRLTSSPFAGSSLTTGLAIGLCGLGIAIALAGVAEFRRARTTVDPTDPAKSSTVVKSGVYRYTRNPMYLGFLLVLVAWAVYLSNFFASIGPLIFVLYMNKFQIGPEERILETRFGVSFVTYLRSVRRWI
jgi:protein-S-isoprenylcysteine O-methyltransferase Ste14